MENSDYTIIGIGRLIGDFYYRRDERNSLVDGGGSVWNILFYCSQLGKKCYAIGSCGNDKLGEICINSLKLAGIDINRIVVEDRNTDRVFIQLYDNGETNNTIYCPICGNSLYNKHHHYEVNIDELMNLDSGMIILDILNTNIIKKEIIEKITKKFKLCLSITNYEQISQYKSDSAKKNLDLSKFELLFLSQKVYKTIKELNEFNLDRIKNLVVIDKTDLKLFTCGKEYTIKLGLKSGPISNNTGSYDAILASLIFNYISDYYNKELDKTFFNNVNENINYLLPEVLSNIGARGYVQNLKKYDFNNCKFCGLKNSIVSRDNNIITNIKTLLSKLYDSIDTDAFQMLKKIIKELKGTTLCVGTGGSYTVAVYASRVINSVSNSFSNYCYPMDIFNISLNEIKNVFLFSYSGTTQDIIEVIDYLLDKRINIYVITKAEEVLLKMKYLSQNVHIISYGSIKTYNVWEKGFISIAGTICPVALFARLSTPSMSSEQWKNEIEKIWVHWENELSIDNLRLKIKNTKINIVDIFYSIDCLSVAKDLESKFVESGYGRVTFHNKKDFSHGRFNVIKYINPKYIIYLSNTDSIYNRELEKYLQSNHENVNVIKLENKLYFDNNVLGEFSMLIGSQIFFNNISRIVKRDLAKPDYPETAIALYKYNKGLKSQK